MKSKLVIGTALLLSVAGTLVCAPASAQEPAPTVGAPAPDPQAEEQIQFFRGAAREEKSYRRLDNALGMGMGAVGVGGSLILLDDDSKSTYPYILLAASGVRLVSSFIGLVSDRGPYDELAESVEGWQATGVSGPELKLRIDRKWYDLAVDSRRSRIRRGVLGLAAGTLFAVLAIVLAADKDLDTSVDTRSRVTGGYIAAGAAAFAASARTLVVRDPIEVGYSAAHSGGFPVTKGLSLAPGGAGGGLTFRW